MNNPVLLEARGVWRGYGRIQVLRNVDLSIGRGESHVVIGPNGAGKSTLFKVLAGELFPSQGSVLFDGQDVSRVPEWKRVRLGLGRTFQVARVFPELSVEQNMATAVAAAARNRGERLAPWRLGAPRAISERVADLLDDVGLSNHAAEVASTLAYGDRKRLELGMTVALEPSILLLDEPTAGMAKTDRHASVNLIKRVAQRHGLSLLLTEHDMDVVFGLATRLTVLHQGAVIASGEPETVRNNERVREVYLGHE